MKYQTTASIAAQEIRQKLKNIGVVATVKSRNFASGDYVDISTVDLSPMIYEAVKNIARDHEYGSFDSMTDSYLTNNKSKGITQVMFCNTQNSMTPIMQQYIWDAVRPNLPSDLDFPVSYEQAYTKTIPNRGVYVGELVAREFHAGDLVGIWIRKEA